MSQKTRRSRQQVQKGFVLQKGDDHDAKVQKGNNPEGLPCPRPGLRGLGRVGTRELPGAKGTMCDFSWRSIVDGA